MNIIFIQLNITKLSIMIIIQNIINKKINIVEVNYFKLEMEDVLKRFTPPIFGSTLLR